MLISSDEEREQGQIFTSYSSFSRSAGREPSSETLTFYDFPQHFQGANQHWASITVELKLGFALKHIFRTISESWWCKKI